MTPGRAAAPSLTERFAVPLLLLLALGLRLREALRTPLWFDELYTRSATDRPWPDVVRVMRADIHPPLHLLYVHAWRVFGTSDLALRASTMLMAMAALAVGYVLARELFGKASARLALLLLALHPWHIYASQEARSYPMLWFALTCAWLGAWRWTEAGRKTDAALFVTGAAVAVWTHYLAGPLLALLAVWGIGRLAREPRRLVAWFGFQALTLVLITPLVPLVRMQFHRIEGQHWIQPPGLVDLLETARHIGFGSMLALGISLAIAAWTFTDARARRAAVFACTIGPLAVVACWLLGVNGIRVFSFKYMLFAVAPLSWLMAAGAMRFPGRVARAVAALVLVALAAHALERQPDYPEASSFRAVRQQLAGRTRPGDVVYHADAHTYLFGLRYYPLLRHRLLAMGQTLPYYDGRAIVPDSAFADASELRTSHATGARWWAVAWGRGALNARAFGALADSLADAPPDRCELVRLWHGGTGTPPVPTR